MQYWGLPFLLAMSRYGRPGFAQSGAMEVVTLEPPTTAAVAATSSTADAQATASVVPSLLYPVNNPVLNNIDSLSVNYVSPWPVVDLVISCGATTEDTDTFSFKADNLPQNGPYDLSPIQQSFNPSQYPIYCHITIEDASNAQNIVDSGQFIMTSTGGAPTRYSQSTTAALPGSASSVDATSISSGAATSSSSTSSSTTRPPFPTSSVPDTSLDPTAEPASATSTSPDASNSESDGLSSGTKAGIAFAIIIFLALLALFIFLLFRYRRKLQKTQSELHETQASVAAVAAAHANEKAYLDSILKVAGKPETSQGGRIVVTDLGGRQSGDWRQFFANKAISARQAISSVGSRGNSRPGSRKTSRPATANESPVPDVPDLPSPSLAESTRGDGSTVGLVSGEKESEGAKRSVKLVNTVRRKPVPPLK